MSDKKISQLTALTGANTTADDVLAIVDTNAAETKKISLTELQKAPLSAGTANGVAYLNGSKVLTTGSALTFDGSILTNTGNTRVTSLKATGRVYSTGDSAYDDLGSSKAVFLAYDAANDIGYLTARNYVTSTNVPLSLAGSDIRFGTGGGGAESMRLTSTGLGINTSLPSNPLTVRSSGTSTAYAGNIGARFESNGAGYSSTIQLSNNVDASATVGLVGTSLGFGVGTAQMLTLNASGNLGLGVTPSAWGSIFKPIQLGNAFSYVAGRTDGVRQVWLGSNSYFDGTNWIYGLSSPATQYYQNDGIHIWNTAPSGTAGDAISFGERMRLTSSGELLIGTTTDNGAYLLQVNSQIWATNATIATSDARLKENVAPITNALETIGKVQAVAFDFKQDTDYNFDAERQTGFIAQDLQTALVNTDYKDSVVKECGLYLGVAYEKMIPVLVAAIQELKAELDLVKAELNQIKGA